MIAPRGNREGPYPNEAAGSADLGRMVTKVVAATNCLRSLTWRYSLGSEVNGQRPD
jgi:hypothetical protein